MNKALGLLTTLIFASSAFADADLNPAIFTGQPATTDTAAGTAGTRETPVRSTPTRPVSTGSSINPSANEAQAAQSGAAGSNAAIGGALMAAGAALMSNPPTVPAGAALMAMGLLAMMQSGEDSGAAYKSGLTGDASVTDGGGTGTNPVDATGTGGFTDQKIKEGLAKLNEAGYKMSEKGLTHPDGSFTPAKAFNSPSSMAAAGIAPAAISESQQILAAGPGALDGARVSSVGLNSGGGGSGSGVSEGDSSGESAGGGAMVNPFNMSADKRAALVAGKTVMFYGEPIGVRGQNIFDMVHSCYQKKRQGKHFIESEHDVATRTPASVKPRSK